MPSMADPLKLGSCTRMSERGARSPDRPEGQWEQGAHERIICAMMHCRTCSLSHASSALSSTYTQIGIMLRLGDEQHLGG